MEILIEGKQEWLYSVQFSHSIVSDSLQPHELKHARLACPSPAPRVYPNSCPLSCWCHPTISSSAIVPFSSRLQSFPVSGSFPLSRLFISGGQSIGASNSASVLPMNIQGSFPLGLTGFISLQSKGLSRSSPAAQLESINSSAYNTYYHVNTMCLLACMGVKSLQLCRTLCNPMDCSPPGSSVLGIFWARILAWVAISFSSGPHSVRSLHQDPAVLGCPTVMA